MDLDKGMLEAPDNEVKNKTMFTIINGNARSLKPKLDSFIDCFEDSGASVAVVTETWMGGDDCSEDLEEGNGIGFLHRSRGRKAANGAYYGGVAVAWRIRHCNMYRIDLPNTDDFEVLVTAETIKGHTRKLIVLACYLPPSYTKLRGEAALDYINGLIVQLKITYTDPYLVIAGDFNQWAIGDALLDFSDLKEAAVGPTRGSREIDKIFTNISRSITEAGSLAPLETEDGLCSDHKVAFCKAQISKLRSFTWQKYTYRHYNDASVELFKNWIVFHKWEEVTNAKGSNAMAGAYQATIVQALERFFPLKTTKKKSTDLPWMSTKIRKLCGTKKRLFWEAGGKRTDEWREVKRKIDQEIKNRQRGFSDNQREPLLAEDAIRNFYKHVKNFSKYEKPEQFDIRKVVGEEKSDQEISESLADYFIKVSREFTPLQPSEIPAVRPAGGRKLTMYEVAARLKKMRKPKSMVPGDIYPQLVTNFSDFFAIPLTAIYNEILNSYVWPCCWKKEFVTVIPKKPSPQGLGDLRNISCTLLASKVFESFVLDGLKLEVKLRPNQYGGVRGLSTDSLLVQLWQRTLENLEDYRAATVITSVDYSKAFNRMSYQHCLAALKKKGASDATIHLISTFLTNRTMTVKVGQTQSVPREVWGGCPQGSILEFFSSTRHSMTSRRAAKRSSS